ncbi:MAG: ketol-acid reductoisomerase [Candidatus Omnitrophica bacterium]|nr:ketol-acid reductoisomerase [Candidatus Omnitrophota bacterium]MBU2043742.1 ketol-acid reductoisomerase [Candidatus Omnitrophota bacterium]MBU2251735.1 ketol-acid reductoisomerase [Candidatus Omnitrophota bacterium]MBU2473703.1 ketol-acid reductoisomerase [Candidatus Omnitrophota bacterium]
MAKVYYDQDADLELIKSKTTAIIGYGIQGRGQSLCLRDSGCKVVVSEVEGTENYKQAKADGFNPVSAAEAAKEADVIQILTQDHVQAKVYKESIKPNLKKGKALCFSHGFNIRFKQIKPSKNIDVFMVAPKGPGALVRRMYEQGKGVPCLIAVQQDATGKAKQLALSYAKAIGGTRMGVIETTFSEETETDLFGEQAVLCGGVTELIKAGFDTLVAAGYQPEIAYFEVLHELKLITDLIQEVGISGMRRRVSNTACYGDLTRGPKVITEKTRKSMQKMLKDIQSGKFAREWIKENETGRKNFDRLIKEGDNHPIEAVGKKLREMMPWMK